MFAGSIPRQGTCLGCGPGPRWGVDERQPHVDVSLFLPPFPKDGGRIECVRLGWVGQGENEGAKIGTTVIEQQ